MAKRLPVPTIGEIFTDWTVDGEPVKVGRLMVPCRCVCGTRKLVCVKDLVVGKSKRCRPCGIRAGSVQKTTHGCSPRSGWTPEYSVYVGMTQRATNPRAVGAKNYVGRGISISPEWIGPGGFERWLAYIGPRPTPKHEIDRYPDNDGNYEPGNVRWATKEEQAQNRRSNRLLTFAGKTQCFAVWDREKGFCPGTVRWRVEAGWTLDQIMNTSPDDTSTHSGKFRQTKDDGNGD